MVLRALVFLVGFVFAYLKNCCDLLSVLLSRPFSLAELPSPQLVRSLLLSADDALQVDSEDELAPVSVVWVECKVSVERVCQSFAEIESDAVRIHVCISVLLARTAEKGCKQPRAVLIIETHALVSYFEGEAPFFLVQKHWLFDCNQNFVERR